MKYYVYTEKDASEEDLKFLSELGAASIIREPIARKVFGDHSIEEADYYVCPLFFYSDKPTNKFYRDITNNLTLFRECPERHIFFDLHDGFVIPNALQKSIVFKVSATYTNKAYGFYYPVPFLWSNWLFYDPPHPIEESKYDISFQGGPTHPMRKKIPDALNNCKQAGLRTYTNMKSLYYFSQTTEEIATTSYTYYQSIIDSKFVMSPRGGGVSSWRLFETLAAGRIPIIISDPLKLPMENILDWNKFSIRIPESDIFNTQHYVRKFLETRDLSEASKMAREIWLTYFGASGLGLKNLLDRSLTHY